VSPFPFLKLFTKLGQLLRQLGNLPTKIRILLLKFRDALRVCHAPWIPQVAGAGQLFDNPA
jgi:hypothetical protein